MKPILRALRGEAAARPPVWLMRQAGRYLPEYRALRGKAKNFIDFCLTPDLAIEVTLQPVNRFQLDAAILFADILLIPHAMGQHVRFVEGEGPRLDPIRDLESLEQLSIARATDLLAPVMQTVEGVRAALPSDTTLIGFAGSPWTVATYMIEGQGGTDHENIRRLARSHPQLFQQVLDKLVKATAPYLIAQIDAGAEVLQLFDSWAGSVPAPLFEMAVIEPTARIVAEIKAQRPGIPIIGFPRAAASHIGPYTAGTNIDAVGIDHMTDIGAVAAAVSDNFPLQGNLDPVALQIGGSAMEREIEMILEKLHGRPFIFNLGHGVLQNTPPENVSHLIALVKGEGR